MSFTCVYPNADLERVGRCEKWIRAHGKLRKLPNWSHAFSVMGFEGEYSTKTQTWPVCELTVRITRIPKVWKLPGRFVGTSLAEDVEIFTRHRIFRKLPPLKTFEECGFELDSFFEHAYQEDWRGMTAEWYCADLFDIWTRQYEESESTRKARRNIFLRQFVRKLALLFLWWSAFLLVLSRI